MRKTYLFTVTSTLAMIIAIGCNNSASDQTADNEEVRKEIEVKKIEKVVAEGNAKTTATIGVEGMTCQMGCANAIKSKLAGLAGVLNCDVAFDDKKAIVEYDDSKLSEKEMIAVIEELADGQYSVIEIDIEKTVVEETDKTGSSEEPTEAKAEEQISEQTEIRTISFPNIFDLFTRLYQGI